MTYERQSLGITEVRAASGIPAGVPGSWWSRAITPEGEDTLTDIPVSRNWAYRLGGGPIHKIALYHSHGIGVSPDGTTLRALGTDPETPLRIDHTLDVSMSSRSLPRIEDVLDVERSIRDKVTSFTGSRSVGNFASCAASHGIPGVSRSFPLFGFIPIGIGAAVYMWSRRRGLGLKPSIKRGVVSFVAAPVAFCAGVMLLAPNIRM